jgi:hypothetical protein
MREQRDRALKHAASSAQDGNGILCPVCFIRKAEAAGVKDAWLIQPEFYKAKP